MAETVSLTNLANLQNENTAVSAINANNAAITAAFQQVLSRRGISPNQMTSPLDMNSNRILNLPNPGAGTDPVTLNHLDQILAQMLTITPANPEVPLSGYVTPEQFGAVGDGSTDDTAAFNAAIVYLNAQGKGRLVLDAKTYIISTLTPITGYVDVTGVSARATIIKSTAATGDVITHSGSGNLSNFFLDSSVVRTSGYSIVMNAGGINLSYVWIDHPYIGVYNIGAVNIIHGCHIGVSPSNTTPLGDHGGITSSLVSPGSGAIFNKGILQVSQTSLSSAYSLAEKDRFPLFGIRNWGECDITNCVIFLMKNGILCDPPTGFESIMSGSAFWLDSNSETGMFFNSDSGGIPHELFFSSGWITGGIGTTDCAGVKIQGTTIGDINLCGCFILGYNPGFGRGVWINNGSPVVSHLHLTGCYIRDWEVGVFTGSGATNFAIVGGEITNNVVGIQLGTSNSSYVISGVQLAGNTSVPINNASPPTAGSNNKIISACSGVSASPVGGNSIQVRNAADTGFVTIAWDTDGRIVSAG